MLNLCIRGVIFSGGDGLGTSSRWPEDIHKLFVFNSFPLRDPLGFPLVLQVHCFPPFAIYCFGESKAQGHELS